MCVCLVVHDSKVFHSIMRAKVGANWFSLCSKKPKGYIPRTGLLGSNSISEIYFSNE